MPTSPPRRDRRREPRKRPRQERSRATVEAILEAAARVFEEEGLSGATTNRIAERAGVSIGTLYQYFPSKESLAVALVEDHIREGLRRLRRWLAQAQGRPLSETLDFLVDGMLALHAHRPRLLHVFFEETPLSERVHALFQEAEEEAVTLVGGLLQSHPEVRRRPLTAAAYMAVQTVLSLTHRYLAHPPAGLPPQVFAAELVDLVGAYLGSRPQG